MTYRPDEEQQAVIDAEDPVLLVCGGAGTAAGLSTFCGLHAVVRGAHKRVIHGLATDILDRLAAMDGLNAPHLTVRDRITAQAYDISAFKIAADELMAEVVKRDGGLRTERRISHAFIMDVPTYSKPLVVTDAAINIFPDLETKVDILQNAIDMAHALGRDRPKVAILSAVETVTPKIPSTIDAAALCKMAERGQITGALLDGPLAFDNAISKEAAEIKHIHSEVAGDPDILLVPDLEAGNMLAKQLSFLANADAAGIVLGARVPIILTSRADTVRARMASCAVAVLLAHARRQQAALAAE